MSDDINIIKFIKKYLSDVEAFVLVSNYRRLINVKTNKNNRRMCYVSFFKAFQVFFLLGFDRSVANWLPIRLRMITIRAADRQSVTKYGYEGLLLVR